MLRCSLTIVLLLFCVGCEKRALPDTSAAFSQEQITRGVAKVATHCNTCHGVAGREMEEMLAPPLWAVRAHYLAKHPEPEAFVDAFVAYLIDPQTEDSLMPRSIEHYGLKAPVNLIEDDMRLAASAIYAGAVERPSWSYNYKKLHKDCDAEW